MNKVVKLRDALLLWSASLFLCASIFAAVPQSAPDNTERNQGDARSGATTADQQKANSPDSEITRKIRAAIIKDKSLSTYAHNVKVITQDGKVTLKGPVRTEKEKAEVEAKAATVAGSRNVTSEIEVAPPKS